MTRDQPEEPPTTGSPPPQVAPPLDVIGGEVAVSLLPSDASCPASGTQRGLFSAAWAEDPTAKLLTVSGRRTPTSDECVHVQNVAVFGHGLWLTDGWDDSSSVSSGISDTFDADDITSSSCRDIHLEGGKLRTDTEKQEVRRSDLSGSDSGVRMESGSKWGCRHPSDLSDESERSYSGRKTPTIGHTGSWRRGMSAQVGVTSPRTKTSNASSSSTLPGTSKTLGTGKTDDAKVSERGCLSPGSRSDGLQRSPSTGGDEPRKPSSGSGSGSTRTPTSTFGFKKHSVAGGAGGGGSLMTLATASGVTITSGSATLGKIPRSSLTGPHQYSNGTGTSRTLSRQASVDDGYLSANGKHPALQYRSLPRPSRTSGPVGLGTNGRTAASRGSIAGVDVSLGTRAATIHGSKRNGVSRPSLGANQTDREKGVAVEASTPGEVHNIGLPAGSLPPSGSRQAGGKYPDVASPTLRRLFGGAKPGKQTPLAAADSVKSSSVISNPHASPCHQGGALHSPSPSASSGASSPLYGGGRAGGLGVELGLSPLASSPSSALSTPSHSLAWSSALSTPSHSLAWSSGYPSPGYPSPGCFPSSLGSLATSSESMDVSLGSVGGGGGGGGGVPGQSGMSREDTALQTRTNGVKAGFSDSPLSSPSASPKLSRNTLPRKQDRYAHLSPLRGEEPRDWLRSHSTSGVQESAFSPSSSLSSPSGTRYNFTQLAGSPTTATNQMSLANLRAAAAANGATIQDGAAGEAYSDPRLRSSNMSLEEKSRTISTSGSFRDGLEEVHGSSLSLVSSTSSVYSTPEEKSQSEIRKLRRELDASQEKVSTLTTQLSANAHLVAAFEQSLSNMTIRLHSLTTTAEQKDGELNTLKKTIDSLKRQNSITQAAVNTAINTPETCTQDPNSPVSGQASPVSPLSEACIRRQPSSDSMTSLTSQTSHSSLGSTNDLHSNSCKKKKKNWLRSSFKQAFGKKKSSKASSQSDLEESLADLSLPSSPQLSYQHRHQATSPKSSCQRNPSSPTSPGLRSSHSNSLISECATDGISEAETVMQLRSELRDKEMKLTDIRLEALSSAHQLDTLREAMSRMQGEMDALKQENSQLRTEAQQQNRPLGQTQQAPPRLQDFSGGSRAASQPSVVSPTLGQTAPSLSHTESTSLDMLLEDSGDSSSRKEGRHVKVVVTLDPDNNWTEECRPRQFLVGCIGVSGKTRWDVLDGVVRRLFKEYIIHVDPSSQLGLNSDSVLGYSIGDIQRRAGTHTPELLPCGYLVGHSNTISVSLKDSTCHSEDSLVFETLIPRPIVQRYISQLQEHRRIILSGASGTGKSYLASRLAEHMVQREGLEVTPGVIATFNVDDKSTKELHQYLCNLADQSSLSHATDMLPLVVILENLHHLPSLADLFNGLLHGKNHRCPYIIGTMIQASSSTPNLQLHQNFRWVLCSNHVEPVKGFLGRFLRRKLLETEMSSRCRSAELVKVVDWLPSVWQHLNRFLEKHSSSNVAIGPRLFLSCPMAVEASRVWFTDLWNYSLIPYLLEAVREGLQLYGRRAEWDNPTSWVLDSFPWSSSPADQDWPPLLQLRPEDVGFHGYPVMRDGCADTNTTQTDTDTDPLMNMLLRLREAAHTPVPQSSYHSNGHPGNAAEPSQESSL
ncbi:neuron navigator 2 [Aplochiton taeniatus]